MDFQTMEKQPSVADAVAAGKPQREVRSSVLGELWRRGSQAVVDVRESDISFLESKLDNEDLSAILSRLSSKSKEFSSLPVGNVISLCQEVLKGVQTRSLEWSVAGSWTIEEARVFELCAGSCEVDSLPPVARARASELRYQLGHLILTFLKTLIESLEYEQTKGDQPEFLSKVRSIVEGEGTEYFAYGPFSSSTLPGHAIELWTLPQKIDNAGKKKSTEAASSQSGSSAGDVTVVLGAGNQSFLTMIDTLYRCLACREVVLVKHHPLRPHLISPFDIILEPLIRRGYVYQVLDQGIPMTTEILSDPSIGHVHITGSLATDTAVRATLTKARPLLKAPQIDDMVTSELGCVTPWIFAPGEYTETEMLHAACLIVASKKANGGCNCLSAQAVVIPSEWTQKGAFRKLLVEELKRQPNHPSYYPGSRERRSSLMEAYDAPGGAVVVEAASVGAVDNPDDNVVLVECGTPGKEGYNNTALVTEAFGPLLAIVELHGGTEENYLQDVVVPFLNNKENIYGSLSCSVIASESSDAKSVELAVSALEYGAVAVNTWSAIGYYGGVVGAIWGAHPNDNSRQSGHGYIGNVYGISNPGKTVVRGPSLTTKPIFDTAAVPPPILMDALHTVTCAPSTWVGIGNVLVLLFLRSLSTIFSPFLRFTRLVGGRFFKGSYTDG